LWAPFPPENLKRNENGPVFSVLGWPRWSSFPPRHQPDMRESAVSDNPPFPLGAIKPNMGRERISFLPVARGSLSPRRPKSPMWRRQSLTGSTEFFFPLLFIRDEDSLRKEPTLFSPFS